MDNDDDNDDDARLVVMCCTFICCSKINNVRFLCPSVTVFDCNHYVLISYRIRFVSDLFNLCSIYSVRN